VGSLQASTLQVGSQTLYRLIDPATARTLCYVRSNDPKFVTFIDNFVGVKGDLVSDPQLTMRVVVASEIATVDPSAVNRTVSAQIAPPSLISARPAEQVTAGRN
jgi:hypothetical protein